MRWYSAGLSWVDGRLFMDGSMNTYTQTILQLLYNSHRMKTSDNNISKALSQPPPSTVPAIMVSDNNSLTIKFTRLPCNCVCIESIRNGVTIINFLTAEAWEALKKTI